MKGLASFFLIGLLLFSLFSCSKPKPVEKIITTDKPLTQKKLINYFETRLVNGSSIHWEPWETDPIKIEKEILLDYQEKFENRYLYYFMGTYPKIVGLADKIFEKKINQWIQEAIIPDTKSLKDSYFSAITEISEFEKENGKLDDMSLGSRKYRFYISYKILLLNPKMISIMLDTYYWCEGVHGYNRAKIITVDLIQKKKLTEKDLFLPNVDYWKTIKPHVNQQIKQQFSELEKIPNAIEDNYFDGFTFKEIEPYFHFALSPNHLIVLLDETEYFGLNHMFIVKIPYQDLKNITSYKSFDHAYSCFTYPENWTGFTQSNQIQEEQGKGILIKYPDIKDQNGKTANFEELSNGIKIEIPFEGDKAVLQIEWKVLDSQYDIPPQNIQLVPTEKEKTEQNWEKIDGVWFKKNDQEKGIIHYQGIFLNTDYQISVHLPASFSDQNKKEVFSRINQIFGTLRFS
jgi:hypothetical protein